MEYFIGYIDGLSMYLQKFRGDLGPATLCKYSVAWTQWLETTGAYRGNRGARGPGRLCTQLDSDSVGRAFPPARKLPVISWFISVVLP